MRKLITYLALIIFALGQTGFQGYSNVGQTTTTATISTSTNPLPVASTASFPASPRQFTVKIDNEYILATVASGTGLTPVTRGAEGTTNTAHNTIGTAVTEVFTAGMANNLFQAGSGSPQVGNPTFFNGNSTTTNALSPVPGVFHINGTNLIDAIFKVLTTQGMCLDNSNTPLPCDIIVDPGTTDTETGPTLVGYPNCSSGCPAHQALIIDNALVTFREKAAPSGINQAWPQDDGLILGPNSTLRCIGHGNTTAGINDASDSALNSIVTTLGGVVLNVWQAGTQMHRGDFANDSGSTATWRILSCTGSGSSYCKTGGSNPFGVSTPALWMTKNDNNIVWQAVRVGGSNGGHFDNLSATYVDINGCFIEGNSNAQVNNALRISSSFGAFGWVDNVQAHGIGTGKGSQDNTGGDSVLMDPGQNAGFCTGSHTPLFCCSTGPDSNGIGGGTCGSKDASGGATGLGAIYVHNIEPGPGAVAGANTGYIMRITGVGNSSAVEGLVVDSGQMGDISDSASGALKAMLSIDSGPHNIQFNDFYFENSNSAGSFGPPDIIYIDQASNIILLNDILAGSGNHKATNGLHISNNSNNNGIYWRGNGGNSNMETNVIQNDRSGYTLPVSSNNTVVYEYGGSGDYGVLMDRPMQFIQGPQIAPTTVSLCGTCNAGAEGTLCAFNNDAAGCNFGVIITNGGGHHGLGYCNGTNWVMATCN
jgi:hypothetical protein